MTTASTASTASTPLFDGTELDFWLGDWDARWGDAGRGTNRLTRILNDKVIREDFSGGGPNGHLVGLSLSVFDAERGVWRQTWVDDSGNYIALTGGVEAGVMTLYGEPRTQDDKTIQMRMVFQNVTASSLHWEWQRTEDSWATQVPMMTIDYVRR